MMFKVEAKSEGVKIVKVKELIKKLETMDKEAYVQIRNDSRWKEDAYAVQEIISDDSTVVEIIGLQGYKFKKLIKQEFNA